MYLDQCSSRKQGKYTHHQGTISQDDRVCATEFRKANRITGYAFAGDDGEGVAAEEKVKCFTRGFRKNTGLGLTLSREILSITGITIRETGKPGEGARFEMAVPKEGYRSGKEAE